KIGAADADLWRDAGRRWPHQGSRRIARYRRAATPRGTNGLAPGHDSSTHATPMKVASTPSPLRSAHRFVGNRARHVGKHDGNQAMTSISLMIIGALLLTAYSLSSAMVSAKHVTTLPANMLGSEPYITGPYS